MATITPYDILRSEVLTRLIQKQVGNPDAIYDIGAFAPLTQVNSRTVTIGVREADISQIGQIRALNAQTPLITKRFSQETSRRQVEMAILSEKDLLMEDVLLNLRSPDTRIAQEAARVILSSGVHLQKRNINMTRYMFWKAVQDSLTITNADGGAYAVDFDFDNSDAGMSASHMPAAPATLWSNPAASVIEDVEAWATLITTDMGNPQTDLELLMSTKTFQYVQKNTAIQEEFGSLLEPRRPSRPEQVADILGIAAIRLYDSTYRDASNVTTRFFPENRVLLYAPTTNGERNLQVLDGPVALFDDSSRDIRIANNPGMRAEIWTSADPPSKNIRVSTSRMPMIIREAVVYPGAVY